MEGQLSHSLDKFNVDEWMSQEVINEKLDTFNKTGDWSIFDDVPAIQHVSIMYPHTVELLDVQPK